MDPLLSRTALEGLLVHKLRAGDLGEGNSSKISLTVSPLDQEAA